MTPLRGRMKDIAEGRVLTPEKCRAYVERWKAKGRLPADYQIPEKPPVPGGPGTELKLLLKELGVGACLGCSRRAETMDAWGIAGCQERMTEIIGWIAAGFAESSWSIKLTAASRALLSFSVNPFDPFGSIVKEALRRAEEKSRESV